MECKSVYEILSVMSSALRESDLKAVYRRLQSKEEQPSRGSTVYCGETLRNLLSRPSLLLRLFSLGHPGK